MAMINCPNCGKQISDRAKVCPGCGYELVKEEPEEVQPEKMVCEECGTELTADMDVCPNCGCPVEKKETGDTTKNSSNVQAVEVTKINLQVDEKDKKKAKKAAIAAIAVVLALVAAFLGYRAYQDQQAEKARQKYKLDMNSTVVLMVAGAAEAENAGGLIHDVWYDTIYENDRASTRKYTKGSYSRFNSDFNTSLALLFLDEDFIKKTDSIKENQTAVRDFMKDLKNPPDEYDDAYDDLKTLYDWYNKLTELAVNPTGNLNSYTSSYNEADQGFMNAYNTMKMHLDY